MIEHSDTLNEIAVAINDVMGQVGYVQKQAGKNLNYTYAGEKALIEAIRPHMVANGLSLIPVHSNVLPLETYSVKDGKTMNLSRVSSTFMLLHTSGEWIMVGTPGEGSDMGDKSLNKAQTGAFKYALRELFTIETGDDPDDFASVGRDSGEPAWKIDQFKDRVRDYIRARAIDAILDGTPDSVARWATGVALKGRSLEEVERQGKLAKLASDVESVLDKQLEMKEAENGK